MISFFPKNYRRISAIAALVLLVALSATASSLRAAPAVRLTHLRAQQSSATESPLPVFELHSGFWVNLHHFLYLQARLANGNSSSTGSPRGAAPPDEPPVSLVDFPAEEIKVWRAAVAFYAKDLARRDLLVNVEMETINNRLAEMETCTELQGKTSATCKSGLQADLVETLDRAAPGYRAQWGHEQDSTNPERIAQYSEMDRQLADTHSTDL